MLLRRRKQNELEMQQDRHDDVTEAVRGRQDRQDQEDAREYLVL